MSEEDAEMDLARLVNEAVDEAHERGLTWPFLIAYLRELADEIEQETAT